MSENRIIIVGAGATGCMVARELLKAGKEVIVLEAKDQAGGRIHTRYHHSIPMEFGAEFIHGHLPATMGLLNEFKIGFFHSGGKMVHLEKGKIKKQRDFFEGWSKMLDEMGKLEFDMTFENFLSTHFHADKYAGLRLSARRFAEGFDVADLDYVSTKGLYKEWNEENEDDSQYRVEGGYKKLVDALVEDCLKRGGSFLFNQNVRQIKWQRKYVEVKTEGGAEFRGAKLVITVPIGVLKLKPQEGGIQFLPVIDHTIDLSKKIGFGSVIKFLIECKEPIWEKVDRGIGFIFSDCTIPTWWTQEPKKDLLLTGWAGGPRANKLESESDEYLQQLAMHDLAESFDLEISYLKEAIKKVHVFNWGADRFTRGAYSYPGIETENARKELNKPIEGVIFLAGEGLYRGDTGGTVEAALINGMDVAIELLKII